MLKKFILPHNLHTLLLWIICFATTYFVKLEFFFLKCEKSEISKIF